MVGDTLELVDNEQLPETQDNQDEDDISDTDSIEDFTNVKGLMFILKKRSMLNKMPSFICQICSSCKDHHVQLPYYFNSYTKHIL